MKEPRGNVAQFKVEAACFGGGRYTGVEMVGMEMLDKKEEARDWIYDLTGWKTEPPYLLSLLMRGPSSRLYLLTPFRLI